MTTVDHKRLGIMYIVYALVFLVIGGIEATIMRIQLIVPHNDFVSPQVFNRMFTMHGTTMIFFVAMPIVFGFANYLLPLMIGARDMAFPAPECVQLLDDGIRRPAALLQPAGRQRPLWGGQCARRGMVRLRAADVADILARTQHRLLDAGGPGFRHRQHRHGDQHRDHDSVPALPGDDAGEDAAARLAESRDGGSGAACHRPADGGADHAHASTATWARTSSTRRPEAPPCCGCTSSGSSVIRKSTFW